MSNCRCDTDNTWAKAVLDSVPGVVPPGLPVANPCAASTWAKDVLDALDVCRHQTIGSTNLMLTHAIGAEFVIAKEDVSAVDCGYLGVGSLIFSLVNEGAHAVVIRVECDSFVAVAVSQPAAIPQSPLEPGEVTIDVGSSFSLIEKDPELYDVLATNLVSPAEAEVNYSLTSIERTATGFKVYFNATITEVGFKLSYVMLRRAE